MAKKSSKNSVINIGASTETVKEAKVAIMNILHSKVDVCVKIEALQTLTKLCKVENTMITNCNFGTHNEA